MLFPDSCWLGGLGVATCRCAVKHAIRADGGIRRRQAVGDVGADEVEYICIEARKVFRLRVF